MSPRPPLPRKVGGHDPPAPMGAPPLQRSVACVVHVVLTLARLHVVVATVSELEAGRVTEAPSRDLLLLIVVHHPATRVVLALAAQTATAAPPRRDRRRRIYVVVEGQSCPCEDQQHSHCQDPAVR